MSPLRVEAGDAGRASRAVRSEDEVRAEAGQADQRLQKLEFLRQPQAPPARQAGVVQILPFHAHGLAEHVLGIEDLHQVDEAQLPWPSLFADDGFEGECGGAMAAAGVEIN